MATKPIYTSIILLLVLSGIITLVLSSFQNELSPKELPIGVDFVSGLLGNDFNILNTNTDNNLDYENIISNLDNFNYTFLINFKTNFPNYMDMEELQEKNTNNLLYEDIKIILNNTETILFKKIGTEKIYAPQQSTLIDRFICSFRYFCLSRKNFKLQKINEPSKDGFLRKINPFNLLLPESLRNEIDKLLLNLGYLPLVISTPIMIIILLGFSIFSILLTIKIIGLLPFN